MSPLSEAWTNFLTKGIPLRSGSWLLHSQPGLLTLDDHRIATVALAHGRVVRLGKEHFAAAHLITNYTLMLAHGYSFQLLVAQGGALPLDLRLRLAEFGLAVQPGVCCCAIPEA